ncbi:MAG: YdcF family protein [Shewanella sp.]
MSELILQLGAPNLANGQLSAIAQARCETTFHCWQQAPSQFIMCTGGFGAHFNQSTRFHANWVQDYLVNLGVPSDKFLAPVASRFTFEDASLSLAPLTELKTRFGLTQLTLVTSDFHMPRVQLIFNAVLLSGAQPLLRREQLIYLPAPTPLPKPEQQALVAHEQSVMAREQHNIAAYQQALAPIKKS